MDRLKLRVTIQLIVLLLISLPGATDGTFTFLYLVGLEGTGHHGVVSFLDDLTFSCNRYFYPQRKGGEGSFIDNAYGAVGENLENMFGMFRYYIEQGIQANTTHPELATIFFSSSFPRNSFTRRPRGKDDVKNDHHYDLEGIIENINLVTKNHPGQEVNIKYLYLEREPFHTVTSHCGFDGDCKSHAYYMSIYHHFLQAEYNATSALYAQYEQRKQQEGEYKEAKNNSISITTTTSSSSSSSLIGASSSSTNMSKQWNRELWAKVMYEWFLVPEQCVELMSTIAEFLEWNTENNCDFEKACANIHALAESHVSKKHDGAINCEFYRYIHSRNLTVDEIPLIKGGKMFRRGINETQLLQWKTQCDV